jgi:cytochrome d ubiquinol oxidase subunit I
LASWLSDPATGTSTVVQGLNATPTADEPTINEVNIVHLGWDIMVGIGTLLSLLAVWYALCWLFKRNFPQGRVFLGIAAISGILAVMAMEAGWVVTEVGRQPWIVHNYLKVENASTTNGGVWITFLVICAIYIIVGVTLILVLRSMSRRARADRELDEQDVPYGPNPAPIESPERDEVPVA